MHFYIDSIMDDLKNEQYCYIINNYTRVKYLIRTSKCIQHIFKFDDHAEDIEVEDYRYMNKNGINYNNLSYKLSHEHVKYLVQEKRR